MISIRYALIFLGICTLSTFASVYNPAILIPFPYTPMAPNGGATVPISAYLTAGTPYDITCTLYDGSDSTVAFKLEVMDATDKNITVNGKSTQNISPGYNSVVFHSVVTSADDPNAALFFQNKGKETVNLQECTAMLTNPPDAQKKSDQ